MGGVIPVGYDCVDHKLIVNPKDAKTVIEIFRQYLRLGCVMKLKKHLEQDRIRSKVRTSKDGNTSGGATYSRGALYHLLNNRVYIGEIVHRGQSYPGQHEAIVPRGLWNQVSDLLRKNNQAHRSGKSHSTPSMLSGMIFDTKGVRFTPTHAVKSGKRYRYYTSQASIQQMGEKPAITRFPAQEIEGLVISQARLLLQSPDKCTAALDGSPEKDLAVERARMLAKGWPELGISKQHEFIKNVLRRVVIGQTKIWIEFNPIKLAEVLLGRKLVSNVVAGEPEPEIIKVAADFKPLRRGSEVRLMVPNSSSSEGTPNASLIKALAYARDWYEKIVTGEIGTIVELAQKTGVGSTYVKRILRYAILSPEIVESILSGDHRPDLTLKDLPRTIPLDWRKQRGILRQV